LEFRGTTDILPAHEENNLSDIPTSCKRCLWTEEGQEMDTPRTEKRTYRNTIGSIVSWAIFRAAAVIGISLLISEYLPWLDPFTQWGVTLLILYGVVLHPMQIQYRIYREETKNVMEGTLCSTCKYFEPTGVMCSRLDEHVSEEDIPCEGELWEPK